MVEHAYGIQTSFESSFTQGSGGPHVVFNAEYDALPDIGHACGHNLIAITGIVAYVGLCAAMKAAGTAGKVRLLGTPAEEGGAGKYKLLQAGAYAGADVCLMAHPGPENAHGAGNTGTAGQRTLARTSVVADFHGKPAHSGGNPWDGINALDAVVAAYVNVSLLRQQIRPEQRIHVALKNVPVRIPLAPPPVFELHHRLTVSYRKWETSYQRSHEWNSRPGVPYMETPNGSRRRSLTAYKGLLSRRDAPSNLTCMYS